MNWDNIPRDEQETIINIDYFERTINVYTTRKSTAERLQRKVGKPTKILQNDKLVYAVEYKRSFSDKDVAKFLSKGLLIGGCKSNEQTEQEKNQQETEA